MHDNQLERIKRKILSVQNLWLPPCSFGAEVHQWKLREPLAKHQIAEFEGVHSIRLPDDYRRFLLEIGDGGLGPSHGSAERSR